MYTPGRTTFKTRMQPSRPQFAQPDPGQNQGQSFNVDVSPSFPERYRGVPPNGPRHSLQPSLYAPGDNTNDSRIHREYHIYYAVGTERVGRESGVHDPLPDGPVRPSIRMLSRVFNRSQGTDNTRSQDDFSRPFNWMGEQGAVSTPIYGGQPGYFLPYGQRGGPGVNLIDGVEGPVWIAAGPTHGLHTNTIPDGWLTKKQRQATPQMRPGRQDRLNSTKRAGQSYSQTTTHQGSS